MPEKFNSIHEMTEYLPVKMRDADATDVINLLSSLNKERTKNNGKNTNNR